jgi:hypothetical protein
VVLLLLIFGVLNRKKTISGVLFGIGFSIEFLSFELNKTLQQ